MINHHACIENEEDQRSMVFLQGDGVPRKEKLNLRYDFSIMHAGDASFEIGRDTGEITVQKLTPLCVAKRRSVNGRYYWYMVRTFFATLS